MITLRIEKEYFHFSCAHFVVFNKTERELLHGHNYHVCIELSGNEIFEGKLVDISIIKPIVKHICDSLDHHFLLPIRNKYLTYSVKENTIELKHSDSVFTFPAKDVLLLDIENCTMENLAYYVFTEFKKNSSLPSTIKKIKIEIEETKGQKAFFETVL